MRQRELHVVIGAGIAGCTAAIMRRLAGYDVIMLEKAKSRHFGVYPICTATSAIVSENHSGAEYPYDSKSTEDCLDGRIANESFFPDFIYAGKTHTRILASQSMIDHGDDIRQKCQVTLEVITRRYAQRVEEDIRNEVFGSPDTICKELSGVDGVNDVAAAFVTPQRGLNPVYVAALLEAEIKRLGIEFRQGHEVTAIEQQADGTITMRFLDEFGQKETLNADQVCIAAAGQGLRFVKTLNPMVNLPTIYFALRLISFVHLPQGCSKSFTCLKLEDQFGGMLSPLNQVCAMIYYPPAAHIQVAMMDPERNDVPLSFLKSISEGHPEAGVRFHQALSTLRDFYPELEQAQFLRSFLKIAINTVHVSRIRRNMPVFQVIPGCNLVVLPKWTMAVINAREDLALALRHSVDRGTVTQASRTASLQRARAYALPVPEIWKADFSSFLKIALDHADNMHLPKSIVHPMHLENMQSLREVRSGQDVLSASDAVPFP